MPNSTPDQPKPAFTLSEDWLAVIVAFVLILLSVLGVLGKTVFHFQNLAGFGLGFSGQPRLELRPFVRDAPPARKFRLRFVPNLF